MSAPLRRAVLPLLVAATLVVAALTATGVVDLPGGTEPVRAAKDPRALLLDPPRPAAPVRSVDPATLTPTPQEAQADEPALYADGCHARPDRPAERQPCTYGRQQAGPRTTRIAVVGDSKIAQWVPALDALLPTHDWQVQTWTMSSCAFADVLTAEGGTGYDACRTWGREVLAELVADPPDIVLTNNQASVAFPDDDTSRPQTVAALAGGLERQWRALTEAGVTVLAVADNPVPPSSEISCVLEHADDLAPCSFPAAQGLPRSGEPAQARAVRALGGVDLADPRARTGTGPGVVPARPADARGRVYLLDLAPWICPGGTCVPVSDQMMVYRKGSHLTTAYAATYAPLLDEALTLIGAAA